MTGSACTAMSCDRNTSVSSAPLIWTNGSSKLSICGDDSFTKDTKTAETMKKNAAMISPDAITRKSCGERFDLIASDFVVLSEAPLLNRYALIRLSEPDISITRFEAMSRPEHQT